MATAFQEYVECPICMNLLQPPEHEPLILVCLHTICSKCFDKIRSDANVQCPFCNSLCDNTMVKKDFRTASLVDAFLKASNRYPGARTSVASQVCGICEEEKVVECKCLQCDKLLCMSCVRGHKAIKELSTHPLTSISEIAKKTLDQLANVKMRLEKLVMKYDEQNEQLYLQAATLDQTENQAVIKLNDIEGHILREVQRHFENLRNEVTRGKEHLMRGVDEMKQLVLAEKCDVGNHYNLVTSTMSMDMFSVFSKGAAVLNGAVQVADAKEQSIPVVKPLTYSVEVVDGLMFDPSMSASIRMTADSGNEVVKQPPRHIDHQQEETPSFSVPMWSDPLTSTRQELYDQLNLFEVLRAAPPDNPPSNPSWSEVVQDQSKLIKGSSKSASAAQMLQMNGQENPVVVPEGGHLSGVPVHVDDWHIVGNKNLPSAAALATEVVLESPVQSSSTPAASATSGSVQDSSDHYTRTKYVAVRRTAYRLHLYNNELWCTTDNALHVFSLDCERVRTVPLQGVGYARAVVRTPNGKLLVADCDKEDMKYEDGLKLLDASGHFMKILMHKKTCDVTIHSGKAYAVKHKQPAVYVFKDNGNDNWLQESKINLLGYYKGLGMHTICISQDMIYLCPKNCQSVYVYTIAGRITGCYGKKGWNLQVGLDLSVENSSAGNLCDARICGEDSKGNVLIADSTNHRLQVLKEGGHWAEITLEKNAGVWDAVSAQGGQVIWVIEGRNNVAKYKKVVKR